MRLPTLGKEADVNEPAAIEMIRYAVDHGVNYVDTAYVYHGGNGETAVGKALADGYRQKVHLATKLPIWNVQKRSDCDRLFDEQLAHLQTDHIDFYLLHCLDKSVWPKLRDLGVPQWAEEVRSRGRIGHLGFSFHDSYDVFVEIVDAFDWSFCQIQHNFCNEEVQAGAKGLKYAAAQGLGVIIMEPLFGGTLANPPPTVREIWNKGNPALSPAEVALRWLWNKPEVSLVLSGMSTLEQVRQNVESAGRSGVGCLTEEESRLIGLVQAEYKRLSPIPCTKCGYCSPCPHGVDIPVNFELYNNATVFQGNSITLSRNLYSFLPETERASACVECGTCEERCPQGIEIGKLMQKVREQFK
jgi:predicted aldo/keto reductase-like oxidoreductase